MSSVTPYTTGAAYPRSPLPQGNLEILPRAVKQAEYNIITGDASSYCGSWLCAVKFANALTDLTMESEDRAYESREIG